MAHDGRRGDLPRRPSAYLVDAPPPEHAGRCQGVPLASPLVTTATCAIPILRIFDEALAYEFYRDFLGFRVQWEHRFADDLPLYAEVVRDDVRVHLSGHFGDGTPGSAVIIEVDDVRALHDELSAKRYKHARPGVETQPWGLDLTVSDPFGNRITFLQHVDADAADSGG